MKERTRILNNMSSSSRSSVSVRPRQVDPPSAITRGAKIRSDIGIRISLPYAFYGGPSNTAIRIDESKFLLQLMKKLFSRSEIGDILKCEEQLRTLANKTIEKYELAGCMTLSYGSAKNDRKIEPLKNPELVFAILSKSSKTLFVASKTPNLSAQLFEKAPVIYDPRIIAIWEAEK